jgi:hypothetical protein
MRLLLACDFSTTFLFLNLFQYVLCTSILLVTKFEFVLKLNICTFSEYYIQYAPPVFRIGTNALLLITDMLLHQRSHLRYREQAYSL